MIPRPPASSRTFVRRCLWARAVLLAAASATAQAQQSPAPPPPPPPGGAAPAPGTLATTPGMRVGSAQIAVVGGNSAGARERALDEALRQTVELALDEILDADARVAQVRAIRTLLARSRGYVKRYRTLEEGEAGGNYLIRVEAEVDEPALRRATERWSAPAAPPVAAAPTRAPALSLLVVSSGVPEAAPALGAALGAAGVAAQAGEAGNAGDSTRALAAAARAGQGAVAFVSASLTDEGAVRGPGKESVVCRLAARVVTAPAGQMLGEHEASPRVFADRAAAARAECLARASSEIAGRLAPLAAPTSSAPSGADLRAVTVDAAAAEPAAVPALLRALRGLGAVSAAELRRLVAGRVEIKVQTRLGGGALAAALGREATALELTSVEAGADSVRLRVALRAAPPPAASAGEGAPPGPPRSP
ncbi:MAG TPA: hypothetical protein VMU50_12080 [Polyangia bacterium]|nr:hypothetical protein [Polyangia bacterium]